MRRLWEQRLPRVAESEADALRELGGGGASGDGRGDGGREANEDERVEECGHGGRVQGMVVLLLFQLNSSGHRSKCKLSSISTMFLRFQMLGV